MKEENIQKEFLFQEVSNSYGDYKMVVPSGYQFFQFLERETSNGYSTILAVFIAYEPIKAHLEELNLKKKVEIENEKKRLEEEFSKRVGNMQLEESFSDILKKFKIGDNVYYYNDYVGSYGSQEKIEDHIKSFTLYDITLRSKEVKLKGDTNTDYDAQLALVGWGEETKPEKAFRTKEEAIAGSKEYHENRLKEKRKKRKKIKSPLKKKEN